MAHELNGKKVAILVADGFEQVEMTGPRSALKEAGAQTELISPVPISAMRRDVYRTGRIARPATRAHSMK